MGDGEDAAVPEAQDLLASYPNLKGLKPICPPEDWTNSWIPTLSPEVTSGKLENGLTFFVRANREPKDRAELYLVVGFGSLVEEEEERGIAHIIEHLGFSATKAYENHAIVKFLESIGAPFGACQNAYTSFDRTVYTLHIPTDKDGILKESLTVLREFAYFTRISDDDLEKERKVVLEEWRESKNAQGRLYEEYLCQLAKGCKYCERLPIGTEGVIRGVTSQTLRAFYSKFYHPARMAMVAVGDFDESEVVGFIKELFDIPPQEISPLPRATDPPDRPWFVVPDSEGVAVASSTDRELSFAQGMVDCKRPKKFAKSLQDFRRRLAEDIFHRALNSRLLRLVVEPKGARNFFTISTETAEPIPPLCDMCAVVAPLPGRMRPALKEMVREIERVKRFGFHEAEISRAKRSILAEFEEEYIERDQRPSEAFAEEYTSLFLDDLPAPSVEQKAQIVSTVMPHIAPEEVCAVASEFAFNRNVVVKISTPPLSFWNPMYTCWNFVQALTNFSCPRPRADLPNTEEVAAIFHGGPQESIDPWPADADDVDMRLRNQFDACANQRLKLPEGAPPTQVREVTVKGMPMPKRSDGASSSGMKPSPEDTAVLGEEIIFPNGLRLFIKDTDFFDDEILLRGRRWGGLTEHQGQGMLNNGVVTCEAQVCSMAAMMLGICGLSVESLQECLDGKRLEPNPPSLEAYSTSFDARSSPVDLEAMLTLVHLMFLCPVEPGVQNRGRLSLVKLGLLASRLAQDRDPESKFQRRVLDCISEKHPYHRTPSLWSILCVDFRKASRIFNERASMPCEWTITLVGRLPMKDILLPLLDMYLGSIPNTSPGSLPRPLAALDGQVGGSLRRSDLEAREAVTPLKFRFPARPVREEVRLHMVDPKGSTVVSFPLRMSAAAQLGQPETADAELREVFQIGLVVRMIETRLIEVLRFKRGQVYGVQVREDFGLNPPQVGTIREGTLSISLSCDPAEADELVEATLAELKRLRDPSSSFTEKDATSALEREAREFEEGIRKNDFWADTVLSLYFARCHVVFPECEIGATVSRWWYVRKEALKALSAESAREVYCKLLQEGSSSAVITMRPKGSWTDFLFGHPWRALCKRLGVAQPKAARPAATPAAAAADAVAPEAPGRPEGDGR